MGEFTERYKGLLLSMFVYWGVCFVVFLQTANFLYVMMAWNTLLALLPLLFIVKAGAAMRQKKGGWTAGWLILWLLFFPNSMYMITDFIHLSNDKLLWLVEVERYSSESGVVYSTDMMLWIKLFVIGMGFFFAQLAGLESIYRLERMSSKKYSMIIRSIGFLALALLTGLGVYIGRFLRFNSWDVLADPIQLVKQILDIDAFAGQFIIVFACFVGGSYFVYRTLRKKAA